MQMVRSNVAPAAFPARGVAASSNQQGQGNKSETVNQISDNKPSSSEDAAAPVKDAKPTARSSDNKKRSAAPVREANADDGGEDESSQSSSTSSNEAGNVQHQACQRNRGNIIRVAGTGTKVWRAGTVSEERERCWASLLYERPVERDETDMSQWLLSVLQVSDPTTSLPSNSSSNAGDESSGARNTGSGSTNNASNSTSNGDSGSGKFQESSRPIRGESYTASSNNSEDVPTPDSESKGKRKDSGQTEDDANPPPKKTKQEDSPEVPV
jgi:hypothetical protein